MNYSEIKGYRVPRLSLGTAALGLDYGISNKGGQPRREESLAILSAALEAGINCLDTARIYGNAEELVGDFLQSRRQPVTVVSKFKISPESLPDRRKVREEVFGSVRASLRALKLKHVPIALLHMERSLPLAKVREVLPFILEELKANELIGLGGISVDHPGEAAHFAGVPQIDAMQLPMNLFDQRLEASGVLSDLQAAGTIVFARSIFLQGLFFLDPTRLPGNLRQAAEPLRKLRELARRETMSIAQLTFSYIRDMEGVNSIVFGAETVSQVRENLSLLRGKAVSIESRGAIRELFGKLPDELITPAYWSTQ